MRDINISDFLKKTNDIKTSFELGLRLIPFVEDLISFVKEIKTIFEDICKSIEENFNNFPDASEQITEVSKTSDNATSEILDKIEGVISNSDKIAENLKLLAESCRNKQLTTSKILDIIRKTIETDSELNYLLPNLDSIIDKLKIHLSKEQDELFINSVELLDSIKEDSNDITNALQIYSISYNQIAAFDNIIKGVQEKLSALLARFQDTEISEIEIPDSEQLSEKDNNYSNDISSDSE